jgi:5'-deoxynucleotidase YfbR-like HD superfamily hydrolase
MNSTEVKQASVAGHFWQVSRHTHFLALLLMAIATLGTSCSGFQASLWNGK